MVKMKELWTVTVYNGDRHRKINVIAENPTDAVQKAKNSSKLKDLNKDHTMSFDTVTKVEFQATIHEE